VRRWLILLPALLPGLTTLAAPGDAAPPQAAPEQALTMELWGPPALRGQARPLAVFFDGDGNRCVADADGLHCVDDEGDEVWGVDLPDVQDVRQGQDLLAVDTADGWVLLDSETGDEVDPGPYADWDLAFDQAGGLVRFDDREVVLPDGTVRPVPEGLELWDVVVTADGRVGALDGGLTWIDQEGPSEWVDLELEEGFVLPRVLDDGAVAVLDRNGLQIVEPDGSIRADVDVDGDSLILAEGELWIGTPDGVVAVDRQTGELEDELVADGSVVSMDADGEALITLDRDGRVRAWDGDEALGGPGHQARVVAVAADASGGSASVDADGVVLRWRAGVPTPVDVGFGRDVAFDGAGSLWVATRGGLVRVPAQGATERLDVRARHLLGLPDGVLVGDGQQLTRLDAAGAPVWQAELAHDRRPALAEGVILSWTPDQLAVIDAESGVRRRRLPMEASELAAAGVAVGGLVVVGSVPEIAGDTSYAGWRPGGRTTTPYPVRRSATPRLGPDGRWVAWVDVTDDLVVRSLQGWPVLGRGSREGVADLQRTPDALVATSSHVWIGREDGRLERWDVAAATRDTDLPGFVAYAQLDAFIPPPPGPEPSLSLDLQAPLTALATNPEGAVAVGLPGVAWIGPDGSRTVPVLDPPLQASALLWDPQLGLIVGGPDGRLVALDADGLPTVLGTAPGPVTDLCTTADGVVAGGGFGLWISGEPARVLDSPRPPAEDAEVHVACGSDGTLAWDDGRTVRLHTAEGWSPVRRQHPGGSRSVALLPDGSVATGGNDETVVIWDPERGQPLYVLEGHEGAVVDLHVDAEGARLLAAGARGAVAWDLGRLAPIGRLGPDVDVVDAVLSPDGQTAWITGREGAVRRFTLPPIPTAPMPAVPFEPAGPEPAGSE